MARKDQDTTSTLNLSQQVECRVPISKNMELYCNKQGSFITEILSTALAAHFGAIWWMLTSSLVVSRSISIPPYYTCMQSSNFTSVIFPTTSFDEKALLSNHPPTHPVSHPAIHPPKKLNLTLQSLSCAEEMSFWRYQLWCDWCNTVNICYQNSSFSNDASQQ